MLERVYRLVHKAECCTRVTERKEELFYSIDDAIRARDAAVLKFTLEHDGFEFDEYACNGRICPTIRFRRFETRNDGELQINWSHEWYVCKEVQKNEELEDRKMVLYMLTYSDNRGFEPDMSELFRSYAEAYKKAKELLINTIEKLNDFEDVEMNVDEHFICVQFADEWGDDGEVNIEISEEEV